MREGGTNPSQHWGVISTGINISQSCFGGVALRRRGVANTPRCCLESFIPFKNNNKLTMMYNSYFTFSSLFQIFKYSLLILFIKPISNFLFLKLYLCFYFLSYCCLFLLIVFLLTLFLSVSNLTSVFIPFYLIPWPYPYL